MRHNRREERRDDRRDPGSGNNHTVAKAAAVVAVAKPGGIGRGPSIGRRPGLG